eukprot:scaffold84210_cov26-Tisochrysis_lutea.AAC.1
MKQHPPCLSCDVPLAMLGMLCFIDTCPETGSSYLMGGPIWVDPIHDPSFVKTLIADLDRDKSSCVAHLPNLPGLTLLSQVCAVHQDQGHADICRRRAAGHPIDSGVTVEPLLYCVSSPLESFEHGGKKLWVLSSGALIINGMLVMQCDACNASLQGQAQLILLVKYEYMHTRQCGVSQQEQAQLMLLAPFNLQERHYQRRLQASLVWSVALLIVIIIDNQK